MPLSLITVNVGAPSIERAHRQLRWLAARPEDVLVLTETKATAGSQFLAEAFAAACPRERPVLVDLFRYLHPERVEHSWARRAELGYGWR